MMTPDISLIIEIMLFAEGFNTAKKLSGKFTKLYKLASEQLSKQDHYDFGLRSLRGVLVCAGALKRADASVSEELILLRALRESLSALVIPAYLLLLMVTLFGTLIFAFEFDPSDTDNGSIVPTAEDAG